MKQNNKKAIPVFRDEEKERDFWSKADTSEYFDYSKGERVIFTNLGLPVNPSLFGCPPHCYPKSNLLPVKETCLISRLSKPIWRNRFPKILGRFKLLAGV